ncbi:bifunctional diaminohydroxyphosphoribosylaminopyrimidine deaminase/5-amino-6-(5-phosphoribosylamino)uracil reductase RibD [Neorickettsia sp. 179522]|uniref:bifunctional diaminohydroxyphosphoribosylaminopyrimidine deaminase/5-amino-6-(5-phosphoribosylamino)uracil reductase RibD n=1 Tax=Neorickettsia sp. 179522 TaxID=1714371 RepID=UPI0009EE9BCF|nr:bifunctional diaminohydroxyphosphoribosylaminopyrimidine deaminase/5-amino-6-(5-phosphoribosylamino)uracil reductase RibD [Neorickettsia sp. 179522]
MEAAVNASRFGQGLTSDNPSVGCIIVKDDEVVGKGVTGMNGSPHAEAVALKVAGIRAKGADLYTTLEPCVHYGRTPPCTDLIIESGIKNVFIGARDPDIRVNGKGIQKLRESGIVVTTGILKRECCLSNIGYFYRQVFGRPFVTLKTATTLDGKIACSNGKSTCITSPATRKTAHMLRCTSSSIMIGYSTLKHDDPQLSCRLPGVKKESIKVVLDTRGEICSPHFKIFNDGIVWSFGKKNTFKHKNFFNFEANLNGEILDLEDVLQQLGTMGINSVLVECGSKLFSSFVTENLYDQIIWFRANKVAGDDALGCCSRLNFDHPLKFIKLRKTNEIKIHGESVEFFSNDNSERFNTVLASL